jgi:hypothetical protein
MLDILLFLLPFALYGLYWRFIGRAAAQGEAKAHPWILLTASGLLLVILSFFWWALTEGAAPEGVYVPAHVVDGEVVPGQFVPVPAE